MEQLLRNFFQWWDTLDSDVSVMLCLGSLVVFFIILIIGRRPIIYINSILVVGVVMGAIFAIVSFIWGLLGSMVTVWAVGRFVGSDIDPITGAFEGFLIGLVAMILTIIALSMVIPVIGNIGGPNPIPVFNMEGRLLGWIGKDIGGLASTIPWFGMVLVGPVVGAYCGIKQGLGVYYDDQTVAFGAALVSGVLVGVLGLIFGAYLGARIGKEETGGGVVGAFYGALAGLMIGFFRMELLCGIGGVLIGAWVGWMFGQLLAKPKK